MSTSSDVLAGLTLEQATAAALTGPVLVLAGAGTGKTKTLTAGVACSSVRRGIAPARILAVTFTNKAAAETAAPHWVGTFHGLGARQLRSEPEIAGLRPGFDIMDADDSRRVITALRAGLPGRHPGPPRGELPLNGTHPQRRERGDRAGPRPTRQNALHAQAGGRSHRDPHLQERGVGGALHRLRDRTAAR